MKLILFKALLLLIAFQQGHAVVTWRTIGCTGWTFGGDSIDAIWDNADLMATNAQAEINIIPTSAAGLLNSNARRAGANAKFMFGIPFNKFTGTNAAGTATMGQVSNVYGGIHNGLQGTLTGGNFNPINAFLFCGGNGLTFGTFPGNPSGTPLWYAQIVTNGVTEYIILPYTASKLNGADWPQPCTEPGTEAYQAKTFRAVQSTGNPPVQTDFTGIILCPSNLPSTAASTLALGFTPAGDNPNPDSSLSLAGTLVHEMAHVYGRSLGTQWTDTGTLFNQCLNLANTNPAGALINPDNYRIFAEMSMSPATKWKAPPPS